MKPGHKTYFPSWQSIILAPWDWKSEIWEGEKESTIEEMEELNVGADFEVLMWTLALYRGVEIPSIMVAFMKTKSTICGFWLEADGKEMGQRKKRMARDSER